MKGVKWWRERGRVRDRARTWRWIYNYFEINAEDLFPSHPSSKNAAQPSTTLVGHQKKNRKTSQKTKNSPNAQALSMCFTIFLGRSHWAAYHLASVTLPGREVHVQEVHYHFTSYHRLTIVSPTDLAKLLGWLGSHLSQPAKLQVPASKLKRWVSKSRVAPWPFLLWVVHGNMVGEEESRWSTRRTPLECICMHDGDLSGEG